jgi:hypothetical protein
MKESLLIIMLLSLGGCAQMFACTTTASYELGKWSYSSCKNQENFKAHLLLDPQGRLVGFDIETNATTPEAATAAALQVSLESLKMANGALQAASKVP